MLSTPEFETLQNVTTYIHYLLLNLLPVSSHGCQNTCLLLGGVSSTFNFSAYLIEAISSSRTLRGIFIIPSFALPLKTLPVHSKTQKTTPRPKNKPIQPRLRDSIVISSPSPREIVKPPSFIRISQVEVGAGIRNCFF